MSEKWTKLRTNRLQENVPLHLKAQNMPDRMGISYLF